MRHRFSSYLPVLATVILLGASSLTTTAHAQRQGGGGFGGGFGGGRQGGRMGQQGASLATVPVDVIASSLKLTDDQKTKIADIQKKIADQRQSLFPAPGGERPDRETMMANFQKLQDAQKTADKDIDAILTTDQKPLVPALLKEVDAMRTVGIPVEVYATLALTDDQKKQITEIGTKSQTDLQAKMQEAQQNGDFGSMREAMQTARTDAHDKAMKVLTDPQKETVEKYIKDHPQPQRPGFGGGGFGGGGRRGGGAGAPPPPNR